MITLDRLNHLAQWVLTLRGREASFVECGVAKGGCLAVMKAFAAGNKIFGFDSFEGMPDLTSEDEEEGRRWVGCNLSGGEAEVYRTFEMCNLDLRRVHVVKGYFEDTIPRYISTVGPVAILRLDNDWYKSTRFCLEALYDNVMAGGVVLVDDYWTFKGCRKAVEEFRGKQGVTSPMRTFDHGEAFWIK